MNGPSPLNKHPMAGFPQVCFIKNTVTNPNIVVGDYTYYDDPEDSENFERNVLYHFRSSATVWSSASLCDRAWRKVHHERRQPQVSGISTYPFYIFGNGWKGSCLSR